MKRKLVSSCEQRIFTHLLLNFSIGAGIFIILYLLISFLLGYGIFH